MADQKPAPDPDQAASGVEPDEEAGAGYGNHAPDVADEPSEAAKDAR